MEGQNFKIVTIGILVTAFLLFGCPEFLHRDEAYISLLHHFFHANIFHLAVNCLSIWTLFRKGARYRVLPVILAFVIATASWFFTSSDVAGVSNWIFALIGLRTPSLGHSWWRHTNTITFLVITALMSLLPNVSATTHIISFVFGCITAGVIRLTDSVCRDYSRATYNR